MNSKLFLFAFLGTFVAFGAPILEKTIPGGSLLVDVPQKQVDLARDFFVTVTLTSNKGETLTAQNLQDRFHGFRVAEDFTEPAEPTPEGGLRTVSRWRLEPIAQARRYRLAPFVLTHKDASGHTSTFLTTPVLFDPPAALVSPGGDIEINPTRDHEPISLRTLAQYALWTLGLLLLITLLILLCRQVRRLVRIHRMSPFERAFYELDVLLKKGLPGRGFYKDFYVELTMVVRRYVERCHAVRAPNLTTEEFLLAARAHPSFSPEVVHELERFLESADRVKFAGVEGTPAMADDATASARNYLQRDHARRLEK